MKRRIADIVTECLIKHNIKKVFSVTGGGAMHLNDAFGHNESIRVMYNHHEQACAMAAEGYTRLSGEPACVCVTSGPGGTNALTGVMGAWLDSIPMIVISGQMKYCTTIASTDVPLRQLGFQEFNIVDCVKTMTKYAVMIEDAYSAVYHLEKAIYIATHGRPGPVWIDIPLDIQGEIIEELELKQYDCVEDENQLPPPIEEKQIADVFKKIGEAKKPVILAGNGIRRAKAEEEFLKAVEKLGIPVVNAWNAHGLLPDSHRLYAGRPGTIGTRGGNYVVQNADLLISLGCRMHIRLISYEWENFAKNAYKIAVDTDWGELHKPTVNIDCPIHADVKDFLRAIVQYMDSTVNVDATWVAWCKEINRKYPVVLEKYRKEEVLVNPYVFMEGLSKKLSKDDVVVASNGTACVCAFQVIEMKSGQRMFSNAGASSMGYGLPAAIGAAFSRSNDERVICLEGDGSIQMNLQELQTVLHYNLNVKIFWLNNDGYHSIRQTQNGIFKAKERGYCGVNKDSGISFPSAKKIAAAYGIKYVCIANHKELDDGIDATINGRGPVICEVLLNPAQNFEPKLSSKVEEDGRITSPSLEDMYPFLSREELAANMYK